MLYNLLYDSNTKLNIPYNSNKKLITIKTKIPKDNHFQYSIDLKYVEIYYNIARQLLVDYLSIIF
jgi:hypothetical protein